MLFPQDNKTWQIISAARAGNYADGAYCVYNLDGILAVIGAAERCRSPAIIQVFPWTMHHQGAAFVRYIVDAAHSASVPVAVQLDHCIKPEDVELALTMPFDTIMVDGSLSADDEEGNVAYVADIVRRAAERGITVEAELGRMEGSEDGVPDLNLEGLLTDPGTVGEFVRRTGVHFLAPSFGNVHGGYPQGGPEQWWQLDRLKRIHEAMPDTPLVLHGTHPASDDMVRKAMSCGMVKINQNRGVRARYMEFIGQKTSTYELTRLQEEGVEIYSNEIERFMVEVVKSAGKA